MFRTTIYPIMLLLCVLSTSRLSAQVPSPPGTGARSIQMFQGKSQNVWIAIYPPKTYSDGTEIKPGTPVSIRVYRSYDDGKTFKSRVAVVSGGTGSVGQGKAGSRKKPWIDMKLKVPVDNKKPYRVVLAVTAVIGKNESAMNASNLTFQYYPSLKILASPPALTDTGNRNTGGAGGKHGPLHGTWNIDGQGTLVIRESGQKVSGTISEKGNQFATLSGTRKGNRYTLGVKLNFEGKQYHANVDLTVSANGKTITGTASAEGQSIPLNLKINGRSIAAK